jgi:hypothetical protein
MDYRNYTDNLIDDYFKNIEDEGDWGLGIGDWPNPQSPIPNPQSPL